jgi:hypothetical protein
MNPFKRKHIRGVAMHVDIATRDAVRAAAPKELTNDDQRILFILSRFKR